MTNKVTHNGKQYEIGKYYVFSDTSGAHGGARCLDSIERVASHLFVCNTRIKWDTCEEINPNDLGKITDAPIELVDGAVYQFKWNSFPRYGKYYPDSKYFECNGSVFNIDNCTNIVKLVPEVK